MAAAKSRSIPLKTAASRALPLKAKPAAKPIIRPAVKVAVKAAKALTSSKPSKPKKDKLVRDSFTIPKSEYLVIGALKQRAAKLGSPAKKSELIRAGFKALAAMADMAFATALGNVPAIKTGRPSKA